MDIRDMKVVSDVIIEELLQHAKTDEETAIILARAWDAKIIFTSRMLDLCAEFGINPSMVERLTRRIGL